MASSPWVILSDFGGAFSMGAIGGGVWHGIKGARNSPRVRLSHILSFTTTKVQFWLNVFPSLP